VRHFLIGTLALMAVGLCSAEAPRPNAGPFESAEVVSAEDVRYSAQSAAVGALYWKSQSVKRVKWRLFGLSVRFRR